MSKNKNTRLGENEEKNPLSIIVTYLIAVLGPYLLILVNSLTLVGVTLEEVWKLLIATMIARNESAISGWIKATTAGLLFGVSELVLYVMNAGLSGEWSLLIYRAIVTVPMHALTTLVIYAVGRHGGIWWIAGLAIGIAIHTIFNGYVI